MLASYAYPKAGADTADGALQHMRNGDFRGAEALLKSAVEHGTQDAEDWNLLGICETELHNLKAAEHAFLQGLKVQPNAPSLHENFGLLFLRNGDYTKASGELKRAVALGATSAAIRFSLATAQMRSGEGDAARRSLALLEGELKDSGEYWLERGRAVLPVEAASAEQYFTRSTELLPQDPDPLDGAATAAERQGHDEKALSFLIRARTLAPESVAILSHFGSVCIRRDLGPDAIDALSRAHRLNPKDNSVLFLLARANICMQNWSEALRLFQEFCTRKARYPPALYAIAWIDLKLNLQPEAERYLDETLRIKPDYADARCERAELRLANNELTGAESDLTAALNSDPTHSRAHLGMGDLLLRRNKPEEARRQYELAIERSPDSSAAHYKLANALTRLHDLEHAGEERQIAARLAEQAKNDSKTQLRLVLPDTTVR